MKMRNFALSFVVVAAALAAAIAQTPAPKPGGGTTTTTSGTTGSTVTAATTGTEAVQQSLQEILEEPSGPEAYHYDPQGRRDPFQSLIGPAPKIAPGQRPPGPPGFLIDEIKLQGVIRTKQQGLIGMINGPDNRSYLLKIGDKVLDGEVIRITASSVVFRQEVNDPTRIERFREVVKDLSPEAQKK
jgi:Tfp pilus assembly protein PilP